MSVHPGFDSLDRIDFRNYHFGPEGFCSHRDTLAAPAVAAYYRGLAGDDEVGVSHQAVPYGLACSVPVVKQMLAVRVIHRTHRELQDAVSLHCLEPYDACCRLFTASPDFFRKLRMIRMQASYKVASVVYDYVRLLHEALHYVFMVFLHGRAVYRIYRKSIVGKRRNDVVLSRQNVASGYGHLRSANCKHFAQVCGLGLKMHRERDLHAFERLGLPEFILQTAKKRHIVPDPFDLFMS